MSNLDYNTITEDQARITTLTWTVANFMELLNDETTKELRTSEIKDPTSEETDPRFQLKLLFRGKYNDIIEIYFLSPKPVFVKYKLNKFTLCRNYEDKNQIKKKGYHIVPGQKWQYVHKLLKENHYNFTIKNSIKLQFEFKLTHNIKVDSIVSEVQLSNDFENLLQSGLYTDVTLKSAEDFEYKVHKVVLASRSKVLKAHFEHNTTESLTNIVECPLESEVLWEVITFIYSNKAPRVDEIPEKLLVAADFYQLNGLKSLCEEALHMKLTAENAIEILLLADSYSASALKQCTLEFIKNGQAKIVTKTEGWATLNKSNIIKMIYEYIIDNIEEEELCCKKKYNVKQFETD